MNILIILSILIFLLCWVAFLINWIISAITISRLKRELSSNYPSIRNYLGIKSARKIDRSLKGFSSASYLKMVISFGSLKHARNYFGIYVDIRKIEQLEDKNIKRLLSKAIKLTSISPKIWIIMALSSILAGIFMSIN